MKWIPWLLCLCMCGCAVNASAQNKEQSEKSTAKPAMANDRNARTDWVYKANKAADEQDYAKALQLTNEGLNVHPQSAELWILKTLILEVLKRPQEVVKTFYAGFESTRHNPLLYFHLSRYYHNTYMFDSCIAVARRGLAYKGPMPDSVWMKLQLNLGNGETGVRMFDSAYKRFTMLSKRFPEEVDVLNNLALVSSELGHDEQVLLTLQRIIKINPTYMPAYMNVGFHLQERNRHQEALTYFNKVDSMLPNHSITLNNRGYSLLQLGRTAEALRDVQTSIKLDPRNSYAFRNRALIYLAMKKPALACSDLQQAIDLGFTEQYGPMVAELRQKHCNGQ